MTAFRHHNRAATPKANYCHCCVPHMTNIRPAVLSLPELRIPKEINLGELKKKFSINCSSCGSVVFSGAQATKVILPQAQGVGLHQLER